MNLYHSALENVTIVVTVSHKPSFVSVAEFQEAEGRLLLFLCYQTLKYVTFSQL